VAPPTLEVKDEGGGPSKTIPWRSYNVGDSVCVSGCSSAADAIQGQIGGTKYRIWPKADPILGPVGGAGGVNYTNPAGSLGLGWRDHYVVVKDGRVYDLLTGPKGEAAEEYKKRFQYREYINFGWETKK
jgi:hypothetical protein